MNNEKGISIIEIMIAMTILAVALLAMMSMFQIGIKQTVVSGNITVATQLANDKMEEIRSLPFYVEYVSDTGNQDIDDFYYPENYNNQGYDAQDSTTYVQEPDSNFPNYERYVNIQYVDSGINPINVDSGFKPRDLNYTPPSNMLRVTVEVIWTTESGVRREHEAVTLIGR